MNWWKQIIFYLAVLSFTIIGGLFLFCFDLNTGEKIYTGYIYSVTKDWGVTSGHLRFSETAGEDNQPSFCVDDDNAKTLQSLAGSGKKVRVKEPAGFRIVALWTCAFPATIEIIEE